MPTRAKSETSLGGLAALGPGNGVRGGAMDDLMPVRMVVRGRRAHRTWNFWSRSGHQGGPADVDVRHRACDGSSVTSTTLSSSSETNRFASPPARVGVELTPCATAR